MLRCTTTHNHHRGLLEGPLAEFYSTTIQFSIRYFTTMCVVWGYLQIRCMEGVLPFMMKLMLQQFMDKAKPFSLKDLNEIILNFEYGYQDSSDKLSKIQPTTLNSADKTKMGQSGMYDVEFSLMIYIHMNLWLHRCGRLLHEFVPECDPFWRQLLHNYHRATPREQHLMCKHF